MKKCFYIYIVILAFFCGLWSGFVHGRKHEHRQAISKDVGQYVIDSETGERKFVYDGKIIPVIECEVTVRPLTQGERMRYQAFDNMRKED